MANTIHEFNHPLWVKTPLGHGLAIAIIDYGIHLNTCWIVALEEKEWLIKHFDANDIKLNHNDTYHIQ
jgi:hypothetical protein